MDFHYLNMRELQDLIYLFAVRLENFTNYIVTSVVTAIFLVWSYKYI